MNAIQSRRALRAAFFVGLIVLTLTAAGATAAATRGAGAALRFRAAPIVKIESGVVQGAAAAGGYAFRGLPYAAPACSRTRRLPRAPVGRPATTA
jgi:para-nitrobenzyl esterase